MVREQEFYSTLHRIEIKLDTFNCPDVKMRISFFFGDNPQISARGKALVTRQKRVWGDIFLVY